MQIVLYFLTFIRNFEGQKIPFSHRQKFPRASEEPVLRRMEQFLKQPVENFIGFPMRRILFNFVIQLSNKKVIFEATCAGTFWSPCKGSDVTTNGQTSLFEISSHKS